MSNKIKDGTGKSFEAKVDAKNRLKADVRIQDEIVTASKEGEAWNIHSGAITLTGAGTMIYIKNNEDRDLIAGGMVIALGTASTSDVCEVITYKNATGGDLLTDQTDVAFKSNRNYGSSNQLAADMYKGKDGGTVTAEQVGLYYMSSGTRLFAEINKIIPRGSSIAVSIDPKLSSGSVKAYCVITCHLKDSAE